MTLARTSLDALAVIVDCTGDHMDDEERSALFTRAIRALPAVDESADLELPIRRPP